MTHRKLPLTPPQRQEALSRAVVIAVAGRAGYVINWPDNDMNGTDCQIRSGRSMTKQIDVQMKATTRIRELEDSRLRYDLDIVAYDYLRERCYIPRYLVVLRLPRQRQEWLSVSEDKTVVRSCAYWVDLRGEPSIPQKRKIAVDVPRENVFNVENLHRLIDRSTLPESAS